MGNLIRLQANFEFCKIAQSFAGKLEDLRASSGLRKRALGFAGELWALHSMSKFCCELRGGHADVGCCGQTPSCAGELRVLQASLEFRRRSCRQARSFCGRTLSFAGELLVLQSSSGFWAFAGEQGFVGKL